MISKENKAMQKLDFSCKSARSGYLILEFRKSRFMGSFVQAGNIAETWNSRTKFANSLMRTEAFCVSLTQVFLPRMTLDYPVFLFCSICRVLVLFCGLAFAIVWQNLGTIQDHILHISYMGTIQDHILHECQAVLYPFWHKDRTK